MARRSTTSATVVPSVSDENFSDENLDYVAAVVQQMALAENSQAAGEHNQHYVVAVSTAKYSDSGQQSKQTSPSKSVTLPISQTIPMNVELTARGTFRLVNNYNALATTFKFLQPFARNPDGTYPDTTTCVMCNVAKPTSVFFPCQHMCVCNRCIDSNDMSPDYSMHLERCVCPVCSADIGLILPHTGTEEDKYWKWVLETIPCLPSQFTKEFKNFGNKVGENGAVEIDASATPQRRSSDTSDSAQNVVTLQRRSTWTPTTTRKGQPTHTYLRVVAKTPGHCLIL